MDGIKSFREVAKLVNSGGEFNKYGEKVQLNDLADRVVVVKEFVAVREDEKGPLFLVAVKTLDRNEDVWFFTRAPWMIKYREYVPFKAKIAKQKSWRGEGSVFFFTEP